MHWLLILALVTPGNVGYGMSGNGLAGLKISPALESTAFQEASEFVVGLNAFNNQILDILRQQSTRNVIVIPFTDLEGKNSRVSAYLTEQMVTSIVAAKEFQIQDNSELVALIDREKISPMVLSANEAFRGTSPRFDNTIIIVGTITDLQKKVAVMARVINGKSSNYAGAAIVYLRIGEEIKALLAADRSDSLTAETADSAEDSPKEPAGGQATQRTKPVKADDPSATSSDTIEERPEKSAQAQQQSPDVATALNGSESDQAIYSLGRENYEAKHYDRAIEFFSALLEKYPESPLADNAYYWIGESFYKQRKWAKAWEYFQRVLNEYPYGNKVPAAILKRGYAEEQLSRLDSAVATMEELIRLYGDSPEADLARKKLQHLRTVER